MAITYLTHQNFINKIEWKAQKGQVVADLPGYPKTLQEAVIYFADPGKALAAAVEMRWPEGVTCPHCECPRVGFIQTRQKFKCKNPACRKQFSVKVGTVMEDSPLSLDKWMIAIWMVANCKNGVSSYELHRALGITQKTAWFLLHRVRLAMQADPNDQFEGEVEVDETYIGGKARNMHYSKKKEKIKRHWHFWQNYCDGRLRPQKPKSQS